MWREVGVWCGGVVVVWCVGDVGSVVRRDHVVVRARGRVWCAGGGEAAASGPDGVGRGI